MKKWLLCLCFAAGLLTISVSAAELPTAQSQIEQLQQAMPSESQSFLQGIHADTFDFGQAIVQMLKRSSTAQAQVFRAGLGSLTRALLVLIVTAAASGLRTVSGAEENMTISMAGALGLTTVLLGDMRGLMQLCTQTLEQVSVFSKSMLPIMATAVSIAGAPTTATVLHAATMFALDFVIRFLSGVLVPGVSAYIAIITIDAAMGNAMLTQMAAFVKWLITGSMKLILTIFMAYITISGSFSGSADGIAIKAARFAVAGGVPVVGGIISDATETMLSGAQLLKNTIGIFGMLCVLAICLLPFLRVGINYLLFKTGTAVISPVCSKSLSGLMSGITDSFGLLLGMLGTCSSILFLELIYAVTLVHPS